MKQIQVNRLTDVELNQAMIWLYPPSAIDMYAVGRYKLEYLSDWNLTMPLAKAANLQIQFHSPTMVNDWMLGFESTNKNPLRAICEVLVMIKLEGMK